MSAAATPHTSTNASFAATRAATPAVGSPNAVPSMPSPAIFDILPDLHKLLSRLQASAQPPEQASAQASADGSLEIHQLATAATELKLKIQRAKRAVLALPDIDRTCEEQQEEINELEDRIARLKGALQGMGQPYEKDWVIRKSVPQKVADDTDEDNNMSLVG
ncbi:hypothetical protein GQ43DRAFT_485074 [Delitschia confertaspora ATCC 74209]|uniref:Mediator of RNA polymerase II transcription subunit 9 n=1 Tax=Delitschia confertaspora ATCC 74209 TaxID=1513339 RepID=A0A9P4JGJ3_9PLEO|nr:hypothetical protein GQ43DRAFT_485074 [Delitschia confertaspora ATCC 74209]